MEISVGQPLADGRYVAFVQCASRQITEWCEPIIATWHGGKWHTFEPVYGWIGPLPVTRCQPLLDAHFAAPAEPAAPLTWDEVFSDKIRTEGGWMDRPTQEYDL